MLWVILITLLIKALSGGPEEVFLVPKLEKQIKTHVVDDTKASSLLIISKAAKKDFRSFHKIRKKQLDRIEKMMLDRSVNSEAIFAVFKEYQQARLDMQTSTIDRRLEFQELFTDDEWSEVINKAIFPSEKEEKKTEKHKQKVEKTLNDYFADIKRTVEKKVSDQDRIDNVLNSMDRFQKTFESFIEEGQQMNVNDSKILRDKYASRSDMEKFYDRQNQLRNRGSREFLDLRTVAIENTDENEWKSINKALTSILSE